MKVPLVELLPTDGKILAGPHKGVSHHYKTALLNTLIALGPKICLEIGTYQGGSAKVFERYFSEHEPDGLLVTADIKKFVDAESAWTCQAQVYPHIPDPSRYHTLEERDPLPDWRAHLEDSAAANAAILREILDIFGEDAFDFAFVDGNHTERSLLRDLEIVAALTRTPHYALLDDAFEGAHESSRVYAERLVREWGHYDFEDWPVFAGTALVWKP